MAKIKLDMYQLSVPDSVAYFNGITSKMTGNAPFVSLASKTTALGTANTALEAAHTDVLAAKHVYDQKLALENAALATTQAAARDLADGANALTHDAATLLSGGWDLQAERSPVGPMPQVQDLKATGGDMPGSVDLGWGPVKRGLQTYLARYGTSPDGPWTQFYAGQASKCTATGLTSGTEYWFEACAVGAAGPGPWSDVARMRAT